MRNLLKFLAIIALPSLAMAASGPQTPVNEAGLTYSNTYTQNLQSFGNPQSAAGKVAVQVTWSSVTYTNASFTDGTQSTGSLTVVSTSTIVATTASDSLTVPSTAAILGAGATVQITVVSTTALAGTQSSFTTVLTNYTGIALSSPSITLNGLQTYTYGSATWASTDTIQHAATTLAAGINAGGNYTASVVSSTGVLISPVNVGTYTNGWVVTSSSNTDISTGTFSGGANPVTITFTIPSANQTLAYTYGGNWASSDTVTHAAATLTSVINTGTTLDATNTAGVIYTSSTLIGTVSNAYTVTSSSPALVSLSSANFSGGLNPALLGSSFTLGASTYKRGLHWTDSSGTCSGTANSITTFINSVSTINAQAGQGIDNVIATQNGCVVNLLTATSGAANNTIVLSATGPNGSLTAGTPTFVGGQSNASITINGTTLTLGKDFPAPTASSTTANMATAIAAAIAANSTLNTIITAQAVASVVNSTSIVTGTAANYTTVSSTQSQLSFSNPTMTGGTNSATNITTDIINLPAHGFTKALPVLYGAAVGTIGGLTNQTTYYVIVVDSNNVQLATGTVAAQNGVFINLTSSTTQTTAHTFTLTPITFTQGSAGGFWQVSNDCVNGPWATFSTTSGNVTVSSQTYTAANPNTTSVQDWGPINFGCVRYNVTGPTWGGVQLKVILNAKD